MSGASVCVLAPNGRRQTVKCTPNTTLLQILEQVCEKQGLKPEEYDLKHHNKILDTSMSFRFSGLPNNAQLELVTAIKNRVEGDIILAVNLENGNRVMDNFKPNDTLLNILNKLCPESIGQDKNPLVIYTRREIYGSELENCTLRSLGLTGGRAMIRVLNRDPELLKTQANISAPLPSKPVEEKPYIRKFQPVESVSIKTETANLPKQVEQMKTEECVIKPEKNVKKQDVDLFKLAKEKRKAEKSPETQIKDKRKSIDATKGQEKIEEAMDVDSLNSCDSVDVKPRKSLDEEEFVFLGSRNAMLFSLETAQSIANEDLPDDFFELTIDDAKRILRDIRKKQQEMESTPLKTAALRNLDESKKQLRQINKYKRAIIRVQFPNRTVLQGSFKPLETVGDIMDFVKEHLEDENLEFYLYSTPPKCILEKENRLMELGLVPGALLYFGCNVDKKEFLRQDLMDKFTSNSVASLAAAKMRKENTRNTVEFDDNNDVDMDLLHRGSTNSVNHGASTSSGVTHNDSERKVERTTENVPKWFRPL